MLKGLLIVEREIPVLQGTVSNLFCDTGMAVRQFPAFAGFGRRLFILISREKVLAAELFKIRVAEPEAVDKVKIRPERREMVWGTADEHGKEIIGLKLSYPVGKAGKLAVKHKDKGAQDLWLIDGRSADIGVERGKEIAHRVKVHGSKFVKGIRHGKKFFEL